MTNLCLLNEVRSQTSCNQPAPEVAPNHSVLVSKDWELGSSVNQVSFRKRKSMLLSLCSLCIHSLHFCHHGHCLWAHWRRTGVAGERGWLTSTVCHFFPVDEWQQYMSYGGHSDRTNFFRLFPFWKVYLSTSSSNFLVTNLLLLFLPSPWPSSQTISHCLCTIAEQSFWPSLIPDMLCSHICCSKFCLLGAFSFSTAFQNYSSWC